jgi:hypothetical protein
VNHHIQQHTVASDLVRRHASEGGAWVATALLAKPGKVIDVSAPNIATVR